MKRSFTRIAVYCRNRQQLVLRERAVGKDAVGLALRSLEETGERLRPPGSVDVMNREESGLSRVGTGCDSIRENNPRGKRFSRRLPFTYSSRFIY